LPDNETKSFLIFLILKFCDLVKNNLLVAIFARILIFRIWDAVVPVNIIKIILFDFMFKKSCY